MSGGSEDRGGLVSAMKPHVLAMWGFWLGMAVLAYLDTLFLGGRYGGRYQLVSMILLTALVFTWFMLDARANGYEPSVWLKVAVVAVAFVAVPYYLVRYKGWRRAGLSILRFGGLFAIFVVYYAVLLSILGVEP